MGLKYFAMPLHLAGSRPARTMEQDLDGSGSSTPGGLRRAWIGEHLTARWENILCPVRTSS